MSFLFVLWFGEVKIFDLFGFFLYVSHKRIFYLGEINIGLIRNVRPPVRKSEGCSAVLTRKHMTANLDHIAAL